MVGILHHRGPDETGIYIDDSVGLGHSRLSIIDLNSGTQPIHNENKKLWIVYNGEVYNYPELKKELQKKGHRFYTTSDTEVVLHLFEEKGTDCLKDLNGQFAFAIWNTEQKELFMARDRVGIRPLHYTIQNGTLVFASEIKSILLATGVSRELDPLVLDQVFTFWAPIPGHTVFKNIKELKPGHYMKLSQGKVTLKQYWDIPFSPREKQLDLPVETIGRTIKEMLTEAIRIRLRADVPVGTYLSGGLDSSGITAIVAKNFKSDVKTFGIRFEENSFDEGKYQDQMVSFLGVDHTEINATNDKIGKHISDCIWHCEKPLLRTAPVPLLLLSELVHENGLKVVLTGEGADEVFGGYNIFREALVRKFWAKNPSSQGRAALLGRLYPYIFNNSRHKKMLESFFAKGLDKTDDQFFSHMIRWENTCKNKQFFSEDLRTEIGSYNNYEELKETLPSSYNKWDCLSKAQYLEMKIFLGNYLLSSQGDRMAMANSLEIRLPYLDNNIIEFMGRIPPAWKILGLDEKHLLKKCFKTILPGTIVNRAKHPYRAPIQQSLLNGKSSEITRELLSEKTLNKTGLFNIEKTRNLTKKLNKTDKASETDNMALMGILSTQLLHYHFIENFPRTSTITDSMGYIVDKRSTADS